MTQLTSSVLVLPLVEKESLMQLLWESICEDRKKGMVGQREQETRHLLDLAAKAIGVPSIGDDRTPLNVFGRTMVAYYLREQGKTYQYIGESLGLDHSTARYNIIRFKDMFSIPQAYRKRISIWNTFKTMIDYETE